MSVQVVRVARGPIEYRDTGRGPAVLLLNGGHTDCRSPFGHETFFREQGLRLIVPSRPGYGRTPSATGRAAEDFAEALIELLDHLGLGSVVVFGISAGGPTALQLAARHPERVQRLILEVAVTTGRFAARSTWLLAHVMFHPWIERWVWAGFRAFARAAPTAALRAMLRHLSTLSPAQVLRAMTPEQQQDALALLLASRSGEGFLNDLHHEAGDTRLITAPTLVIESEHDGSMETAGARAAQADIPGKEVFVVPAESHLVWFSRHKAAIEARLAAFLEASQSPGAT
jgi:pimeloyl-ACP methyl ester carboxylesterase